MTQDMDTDPRTNPNTKLNLDRLCKLLSMTTTANDHEALAFMRKANKLLAEAGWGWDKLLAGKVTVIASPFADLPEVAARRPDSGLSPVTPSRPQAAPPRPAPQAAPQQPPWQAQQPQHSQYTPPPRPRRKKPPAKPAFSLSELGL